MFLPESAIKVSVQSNVPDFVLPENSIQVNVQERKRARKTIKSMLYDAQSGRPTSITEEEAEE